MHPRPAHLSTAPDAPVATRCPYQRALTTDPQPAGQPREGAHPHKACGNCSSDDAAEGTLFLVGVNHHTAPVELRERFCQSGELATMLHDLRSAGLAETAILFTCNRFEVYAVVGAAGRETVTRYLAERCGMSVHELVPTLYHAAGTDAALHLMRVAAGLESIVLGEPQIQGQVADALAYAHGSRTIGPLLTRLFTSAVHAGKRARSETAISRHTLSISHAGVLLLESIRPLADARVLVVGAGEMARLAVRALQAHGTGTIIIANRTLERATSLAHGAGQAVPWDALGRELARCDAVIAATAATTPLIRPEDLDDRSSGRPIQLIDLGVPRNIDSACAQLPGALLRNVDDLERVVESHRVQRQREAARVEELLDEELAEFTDWLRTRNLAPRIAQLRDQAAAITEEQLERTLRRLPNLSADDRAVIEKMARHISNGLLHAATVALKNRDRDESADRPAVSGESYAAADLRGDVRRG